MSDQTVPPYEPGTRVWCKAMNLIWWPGRIVSLKDTPDEFQEYVADKKKNCIAVVYYESDQTHEPIINMNKLMLYDCSNKLQFVEKGFALYEKQQKGIKVKNCFKMENFIEEVKIAERDIGGDENIFEKFAKKNEIVHPKFNVKEHFISSKDKIKKRKSIATNKVENKFSSNKPSGKSPSLSSRKIGITRTPIQGLYHCHGVCGVVGCTYKSSINADFQMHLKLGRENKNKEVKTNVSPKTKPLKLEGEASSSNSNNRKHARTSKNPNKTKKPEAKKIKLQVELLKDWEDESDDSSQNKSLQHNKTEGQMSQSSSCSKSTQNKVFDFDDDDDDDDNKTSIENLRHLKGINSILDNSGSILNKINNLESFSEPSTSTSNFNSVVPNSNNTSEVILENESTENIDENLILNDSKSINEKKESEENTENEQCLEDSTTANISTDGDKVYPTKNGHSKGDDSTPDWVKDENWGALKQSEYEAEKGWAAIMKNLPDLSSMKFEDALKPIERNPSDMAVLNNDIEIELQSDTPEPGYEHRTLIIPVNKAVKTYSDEELLKLPLIQKLLNKIEIGDTDNMFVYFPGAKLLPKK